jgi:hypothetical protein
MSRNYTVENCEHISERSYEDLVADFDAQVGDAEYGKLNDALNSSNNLEEWTTAVQNLIGPSDFLRVFTLEHGRWSRFYGQDIKAKRYVFGSPLIFETMFRHDVSAGQQAPGAFYVYEGADGRSRVTYDLPSSIFGYIGNPELTEAARALDAKLTAFVEKITGAPVSD